MRSIPHSLTPSSDTPPGSGTSTSITCPAKLTRTGVARSIGYRMASGPNAVGRASNASTRAGSPKPTTRTIPVPPCSSTRTSLAGPNATPDSPPPMPAASGSVATRWTSPVTGSTRSTRDVETSRATISRSPTSRSATPATRPSRSSTVRTAPSRATPTIRGAASAIQIVPSGPTSIADGPSAGISLPPGRTVRPPGPAGNENRMVAACPAGPGPCAASGRRRSNPTASPAATTIGSASHGHPRRTMPVTLRRPPPPRRVPDGTYRVPVSAGLDTARPPQ